MLISSLFLHRLVRISIAQQQLLQDATLITKLSMDIDLGNSLFNGGNKSRNTAIEILLGDNIKNQNLKYLTKLVIKDPVLDQSIAEKEIHVDLKLDHSFGSVFSESSDPNDDYIDLTEHESGSLLILYRPETNMALANKSNFQANCGADTPDASGSFSDSATKGCICTSDSPLLPWTFDSCLASGILSNTVKPVFYPISDLEFNDVVDDILLYAQDISGEEALLAQYRFNQIDSNVILSEPIPINQFDKEFNIGLGGINRTPDGKLSMGYSESTVLDREVFKEAPNLYSDYRWQPKMSFGRLNNPFTSSYISYNDGMKEELQVKSGRTSLHHGVEFQFPNRNLWNFLDTRPLHIWSELAWGPNLNDRRIYWKVRVKYYQGQLIKGQDGDLDTWGHRNDNTISEDSENTPYFHAWLPQEPNLYDLKTKGAIHISGRASGVFTGAVKESTSTFEACSPLLKLSLRDGTLVDLFPDSFNVKEDVEFKCSDPDGVTVNTPLNSFYLNLVKPDLPDKVEQPIFRDEYFDEWITRGQFFLSDIALVELGWQNIVAMDKDDMYNDPSKIVLKSPESHYKLKSYMEFPFYPGHYVSSGSTAASVGDDPWNRRNDQLCERSAQSFVSDLKNYVHSSYHSGDPDAPSAAWAVDPAYGYCEYCGVDECCCNRLNSSELIRDNQQNGNIGQRFEVDPLDPANPDMELLTGWSEESPLKRAQKPCSWDDNLRRCSRTATYCSDCNVVGKLSAPSCCLNLSQAPNGPRCMWENKRCEDAPQECQACNSKDTPKDCCDVRRDECTWLSQSGSCTDLIEKCVECLDSQCCSSIEDSLLCQWNTASSKCETTATTCEDCQQSGVWTEGCCNNVSTTECEYINNGCLEKPQSCSGCNDLDDSIKPSENGSSAEINHNRQDCCKSTGLDCIWLTNKCESTVDSCVKCNGLDEYSQECCTSMEADLGCAYDPVFGCLPDASVSCRDCNALDDKQECCLDRPWCQWYNSDGTIGISSEESTNSHGVCLDVVSSCEDCNVTPFVDTCCQNSLNCAMFEKLCHDQDFNYFDKCYSGYLMGDVVLSSACLSLFGLILAMITHWLASDDLVKGGANVEVEEKVVGAGVAVVNSLDDFMAYDPIPSSAYRSSVDMAAE